MSRKSFEEALEDGGPILDYLDPSAARWVTPDGSAAVPIKMPLLIEIDARARLAGISREALIERWRSDRLKDAA